MELRPAALASFARQAAEGRLSREIDSQMNDSYGPQRLVRRSPVS